MKIPDKAIVDQLRATWSDRFVTVKAGMRDDLKRFEGRAGRVITVNYSGRAVVDFADGAWYDIADFENVLVEASDDEKKTYDSTVNSAQKIPQRQS